ncbi:MAG: NAD(+) diphosphatase [Xanthomonadales bacterium]|nr:NAD(+) diphosphatase [Xanthomonadales bacterium]
MAPPSRSEPGIERSRLNGYARLPLRRPGERLEDEAWLAAQRSRADARAVLLDGEGRAAVRRRRLLRVPLAAVAEEIALLGLAHRGRPVFLAAAGALPPGASWQGLREASATLDPAEASLFAFARALRLWHERERHCPACGTPTRTIRGGHARECPGCGRRQFPRIDPCVIVLIRRAGRCLLVRQPHWPERRFSLVAGFVEPGETLEEAVRREVREEVGLGLVRVAYHSSQPWPFPGSLMIAFSAEAGPGRVLPSAEIAEARWWTPRALGSALARGELAVAPPWSVAHRLIRDFVEENGVAWPGAGAGG